MLYLVDASIFIYDAWLHGPDRRDRLDRPAGAMVGFAEFLCELIRTQAIRRVACAYDGAGRGGVRNRLLPAYKACRPPVPDALGRQLALCSRIGDALGIAGYTSRSVEADDLIGMLARDGRHDDEAVIYVTGDKDIAQFVGPRDHCFDPRRNRRVGAARIRRRFGVKPAQIPDWLALCGDSGDGIPGVPGIGPATAARLLRYWGSLPVLLAHTERVATMKFRGAPQVAEALDVHRDTILLARRLTGLIEDPGQAIEPAALDWKPPAPTELTAGLDALDWSESDIEVVLTRCAAARRAVCAAAAC